MSLRRKAFSAVRWTASGSFIKTALQVIQVAVLARILSPADYGLMAVVLLFLGLATLFTDFGLNSAFLQRREVTENQRSSLYWLNVFISLGLMLLVIALSPYFAQFFNDDRLVSLISLSSLNLFLAALGIQVRIAAEKALLFRPVMIVEVISTLVGISFSVVTAMAGWGVYSLVVGLLITTFVTTLLLWLYVSEGWRPKARLKLSEVRPFLGFGGALVANNFVNHIKSSLDIFFAGRMLAASQLGLYSVPRDLVFRVQSVVNPIITRVAFPLIAEVQDDVSKVRSIYLQTLNMTASTNAPIYIGIAVFADGFVDILLGSKWGGSVQVLQILAIWGAIRSTGNPVGSLLLGMGRADLSLKWNLSLMLVVAPAIWFGSQHGPEGVAWSLLTLSVVLFVPGWFFLVRPLCEAKFIEYTTAALRPFVLSVIAIYPAYMIASEIDSVYLRVIIGCLIATLLYISLSYLVNRKWVNSVIELFSRLNKI